jgi:hypothetical protein
MVIPPISAQRLFVGFALRRNAFAATVPAREIGKTGPFRILFNRFFRYFAGGVGRFCCAG